MIADLKPYAEYKESGLPWLNKMPQHWKGRRLRSLSRRAIKNGVGESAHAFREDWPRYIRITDISAARTLKAHTKASLPPHLADGAQLVDGDLLLAAVGATYGKSFLYSSKYGSCCFAGYLVRVAPNNEVPPEYLSYWTESAFYWDQINSLVIQSTIQNFSATRYKGLRVCLPPPEEQAAIVRFLDWANGRLERAIRAKRKVIALLNEQKQAIIHRAVTRGRDPSVRLKASGIPWLGDIPLRWEVRRLKFVASRIVDCLHATPRYSDSGNYPAIRTADIAPGVVHLARAKRISSRDFVRWTARLEPGEGDILYSREGERFGIAACVPAGVRLCISQRMMVFRIGGDDCADFVMRLLNSQSTYGQALQDVMGATAPHVNISTIRNYFLALPPKQEQEAIVLHIKRETSPTDIAISRLEREIALLREYRTRLVADVVTGKLDVREAAARLPDEAAPDTVEDDTDLGANPEAADEGAVV